MSLSRRQLFEFPEYLAAMGISTPLLSGQGMEGVAQFPGVELDHDGRQLTLGGVTSRQIVVLCGNGMHLAVVGMCPLTILVFAAPPGAPEDDVE